MANETFLGHTYTTPVRVRINAPAFTSDTLNLRLQSVSTGVSRYEFDISFLGDRTSDLHMDILRHYTKYGVHTAFDIPAPQNANVEQRLDFETGVLTVDTDASAGDTEVRVVPSNAQVGGYTIPAGLFIRFTNHPKLYQVAEDATTTSNLGTVNVKLTIPLTNDVPHTSTTMRFRSVNASVKHDSSNNSLEYTDGVLQRGTFRFIENLL